jgi:hypothetical protein
MVNSNSRILMFVVCVVIGASAFVSASASAAPQWLINKAAFSGEESISIRAQGAGPLRFFFNFAQPGGAITVTSCENVETRVGRLFGNRRGRFLTRVYVGCKVDPPAKCTTQKQITTGEEEMELTDLGGAAPLYMKFTPVKQPFTAISLMECAGEGKYNVSGTSTCKVVEPTVEAVEKACVFSEAKNLLGSLKIGASEATLSGTLGFTLSGANVGKTWSANL